MSITVAELLAEPQLGLSLLAGSDGLQQRITWAHTSDLPRLWEWVTGGEIMMTNGLSIPADPAGQAGLAHLGHGGFEDPSPRLETLRLARPGRHRRHSRDGTAFADDCQ